MPGISATKLLRMMSVREFQLSYQKCAYITVPREEHREVDDVPGFAPVRTFAFDSQGHNLQHALRRENPREDNLESLRHVIRK